MDTSMFVKSKQTDMSGSSYLIIEHTEYGLAAVRYAQEFDPAVERRFDDGLMISLGCVS